MISQGYWMMTLLVASRTSAFMMTTPFLKGRYIPFAAKMGIILPISLFVASQIEEVDVDNTLVFFELVLFEIIVGMTLGFLIELISNTIRMAGSLIDQDIGLANPFFDPNFNAQSTTISRMFFYVFLIVFILMGGINKILQAFVRTFELNAKSAFYGDQAFLDFFIDTLDFVFLGAIQIAIPFMMSTFLIYIAMLMMSKTVDKINLLMNIFGIKIMVGMIMLLVCVPVLMIAFEQVGQGLMEKFVESFEYMFVK